MTRLARSLLPALGVATLVWIGAAIAQATETPKSSEPTKISEPTKSSEPTRSSGAFEQLAKFLVGKWSGVHEGTPITLTYVLTANDSALMEEFRPQKGPVMITMFTVDDDHLVAAHYCSAGNQPYMVTEAITDPQSKRVTFMLTRVTGLKTPEDWHNTGLVLMLDDSDHLSQEWTYRYHGETGKTMFHFTRAR